MDKFKHTFYSGMSSSSDLLGAIDAGVDIGVVAGRLAGFGPILSLSRHLKGGHAVFIDSGAFGERLTSVEPDWNSVMTVYESIADLADSAVSRLYVVAPDKVGDQQESLIRLMRFRDRVRKLIDAGVQVIVPYQAGQLAGADLHMQVKCILGCDRFIVGVPSNRDAMPTAMLTTIVHHAYHVLGRVKKDSGQIARLAAIATACADATITADASWILSRMNRVCEAARQIHIGRRKNHKSTLAVLGTSRREAVYQTIKLDSAWST